MNREMYIAFYPEITSACLQRGVRDRTNVRKEESSRKSGKTFHPIALRNPMDMQSSFLIEIDSICFWKVENE